ncbi:MAG: glutamate--cysteine ligase [Betaproteobacteria bacterium]|nr:glutamate--cysteine ligase [Betaproteobacteria bacterium]
MNDESLFFKPSRRLTLGVELELQIVNTRDFNLSLDAGELLRGFSPGSLPGDIKPEMTQSMIEVNSSVHADHAAVLAELRSIRDALRERALEMNVAICGGGTHPFQAWNEQKIFPTERFNMLQRKYGYLAKQFTVFGQHVHIGCDSGDDAMILAHCLGRYVPQFIALSAASPWSQGVDTLFDSCRSNVVRAFPLSGTPPLVTTWRAFQGYFERMKGLGIVGSMKDFYWDVRPKPEYGTVEIRVFDTPLTVDKAADLAAYAQALAGYLLTERPAINFEDLYLVYNHNRFEAARHGFAGSFVDPDTRTARLIGDDIRDTIRRIRPHARALDCEQALDRLLLDVSGTGNDAHWSRTARKKLGSLSDLVRVQGERWAGKKPRG